MPGEDSAAVARDLSTMAGYIGQILNDPTIDLTDEQSAQLTNYGKLLTADSDKIADQDAMAALNAAQRDLTKITQATSDANAAAARLKKDAQKLNSLLALLGDAVSLGANVAILGRAAEKLAQVKSEIEEDGGVVVSQVHR